MCSKFCSRGGVSLSDETHQTIGMFLSCRRVSATTSEFTNLLLNEMVSPHVTKLGVVDPSNAVCGSDSCHSSRHHRPESSSQKSGSFEGRLGISHPLERAIVKVQSQKLNWTCQELSGNWDSQLGELQGVGLVQMRVFLKLVSDEIWQDKGGANNQQVSGCPETVGNERHTGRSSRSAKHLGISLVLEQGGSRVD